MTATMFYAYDMEVEIGYNPTIRYHDKYVHTLCKQFWNDAEYPFTHSTLSVYQANAWLPPCHSEITHVQSISNVLTLGMCLCGGDV